MDYVHEMRQKIGHSPLILAGATVLIFNDQEKLLMLLRTDIDCWGIPGGSMELGETLEETAVRETLEETGLQANHLVLFDVFSGPELYFEYPNGDITYNVSAAYTTHDAQGEITLGKEEHTRWGFFPLDDLPDKISPPIKPVLEKYKRKISV